MRDWKRIVRSGWRKLLADRNGSVAVMAAMSLTAVLGVAGLGTEATLWYVAKRDMQGAADAAAFSAATAEAAGQNSTAFTAAADAVAAQYGFTNAVDNVTVTVNNPPQSGNYTTNDAAVEVIVSQPQPLLFSRFFLSSPPVVSARAVAVTTASAGSSGGNGCVMALDQGNITDVNDNGGATLNLKSCSLYVNSSKSNALSMTGGAQINADSAYIVGNYTAVGGAKLNASGGIHTGVDPASDPYANAQIPSYSGCNQTNYSLSSQTTANIGPSSPGGVYVFCQGLSLTGGSTLNLAPGTYVIDRGSLSLAGGTTLNAPSDVTIVLTSSTGSGYGSVSVAGGASLDVSAPTTGSTAGLAFFQDRHATAGNSNNFTGGTGENIEGAIYFPDGTVEYSGGAATGGASCTQLIGLTLSFVGTSNFNSNCSGTGVQSIGGSGSNGTQVTQLVE